MYSPSLHGYFSLTSTQNTRQVLHQLLLVRDNQNVACVGAVRVKTQPYHGCACHRVPTRKKIEHDEITELANTYYDIDDLYQITAGMK